MPRKTKKDYEGYYFIKKSPQRMKIHNRVSWEKIEQLSKSCTNGQMSFDQLSITVKDHLHGDKSANYPYQFITYCIKSGWLERV